jgi:hypothetical protein
MMKLRNKIISILLPLTLSISGCLGVNVQTVQAKEVTETTKTTDSKFSFNPHVCPEGFYKAYGEEYWTSFFNLCDALREGKDTFKCASGDAYVWCMVGGALPNLFPAERNCTEYLGLYDGYSNGVGKISYSIPKEEFVKREREFEKKIEDVLNANVKKSDTDFEKCAALYKYIVDNYAYDHDYFDGMTAGTVNNWEYGIYRTFMTGKGICGNLSGLYNYLLLQCGVDAYEFHDAGMVHAWSYVVADGVGYHVDPTWGFSLENFMTPSSVRKKRLEEGNITGALEPMYYLDDVPLKKAGIDFSANDDRFAELRKGWKILEVDRDRKVIKYDSEDGVKEFAYGKLNK